MLFNRFLLVRFKTAKKVIGGVQAFVGNRVVVPPTISFDCSHTNESAPNEATVRIYNIAPETQKELFVTGQQIEIEAGYWPVSGPRDTGVIFKGQIRKVRTYTENSVDVISELTLGDGDDGARSRRSRRQFPAGTSHGQIVAAMVADMAPDGIVPGSITVPNYVEPRATTIDRPCWRELEDICHQHSLLWSVQDGVLNAYPARSPLVNNAVVLTPNTGVIDTPQFTDEGVDVKTLMLHFLRPGHTFILRNELAVNRAPEKYRIEEISFSGDNGSGDFGTQIKAKIMGTDGKVRPTRDRQTGRRA